MEKLRAVEVTINLVGTMIRSNMEQIVSRIKAQGDAEHAHTHLTEVYELTFEGGMNDTGAIYVSLKGDKLVFKGRGCYEHLTGELDSEIMNTKYLTRTLELKESNVMTYLNSVLFDIIHVMNDTDTLTTFTPVDEKELEATGLNKDEILKGVLASYNEFLDEPEKHITWEWIKGGLMSSMSRASALELFRNMIEQYNEEELEFIDTASGEPAPDTSINVSWRIVSAI